MPRPALIWLLPDTHFNDANMLKFRPKNYEQLIIKRCRSLIAPQDTLIHLGDVIFSRPGELKTFLAQIPGKTKILVRGNHDKANDPVLTMLNLPQGCSINIHGHFHTFSFRTEEEQRHYNPTINKLLALELTNYAPVTLQSFLPNIQETPNQSAELAKQDSTPPPQTT